MRVSILLATVLILAAPGSGGSSTPERATARPAAVTRSQELSVVTWDEVAREPGRFLGQRVRLVLQFRAEIADWNPYVTRFGSAEFVAVQGWSDEQLPWIETEYERPVARVFARRAGPAARELSRAESFGRYDVEGIVRECFLDLPWIEIERARSIPEQITEATVIHAAKALALMEQQAWRLAELELETALAAPLPEPARVELERLRAICRDPRSRTRAEPGAYRNIR